jgi:hypothetical protein
MLTKISKYNKETVKKNKTTLFLLPLLELNYSEIIENGFVNAYLGDDGYEIICDNHMFLLFNPHKFTIQFEAFAEKLRQHPCFSLEYDCPDNKYGKVMFVFGIPPEYNHVVANIKKGEYSKVDKRYVNKFFPKFIDGKVSIRWKVFYKDPSLKAFWEEKLSNERSPVRIDNSAELWDKPDACDEIINFNKEQTNYW